MKGSDLKWVQMVNELGPVLHSVDRQFTFPKPPTFIERVSHALLFQPLPDSSLAELAVAFFQQTEIRDDIDGFVTMQQKHWFEGSTNFHVCGTVAVAIPDLTVHLSKYSVPLVYLTCPDGILSTITNFEGERYPYRWSEFLIECGTWEMARAIHESFCSCDSM